MNTHSIDDGDLWDIWDRMSADELAMYVGLFGFEAVPRNLHRRRERLIEAHRLISDGPKPNADLARKRRVHNELAAMWQANSPVAGSSTPTDPLKRMQRKWHSAQYRRRQRARRIAERSRAA